MFLSACANFATFTKIRHLPAGPISTHNASKKNFNFRYHQVFSISSSLLTILARPFLGGPAQWLYFGMTLAFN